MNTSSFHATRILYDKDTIETMVENLRQDVQVAVATNNTSIQYGPSGQSANPLYDRLVGSIWGQAYGDVIGCPIEGWKSGEIRKFYGRSDTQLFDFGLIIDKGFPSQELLDSKDWKQLRTARQVGKSGDKRKESATELFLRHIRPVGIHSDDTQQGMALCNAILEFSKQCLSDELEKKSFGVFWAKWLKDGYVEGNVTALNDDQQVIIAKNVQAFRQYGSNTTKALKKLMANKSAFESGSKSTGIGGMMRCFIAPVVYALKNVSTSIAKSFNQMTEGNSRRSHTEHEDYVKLLSEFSYIQCLTTHSTIESSTMTFASNLIAYKFIMDGNSKETIDWILSNVPTLLRSHEKIWFERCNCKELKKADLDPNKFTLYEPLRDSIHTTSDTIEKLFEFIKDNWDSVQLLKDVRGKISEFAKTTKDKSMKGNVNQGFCLLGGVHCIAMALMPENEEIIYVAHPSKAKHEKKGTTVHSFPELLMYSIVTNGYDTDTVGAISGMMIGARFGSSLWLEHKSALVDYSRINKYCKGLINILEGVHAVEPIETVQEYQNSERLLSAYCSIQRHIIMDKYVPVFRKDENEKEVLSKRIEYHSLQNE